MRLRWTVGLLLMLGSSALAGWTQNAPAPPAAPGGSVVKLAYKYRQGAVSRMHFSTTGTIIADVSRLLPGLQGIAPSAITADVSAEYDVLQTVTSVSPDGSAMLAFTLESMTLKADSMGEVQVARLQNGKLIFTKGGERVPLPHLGSGPLFAGRKFQARVSPTGQVLENHGSLAYALDQAFSGQSDLAIFSMACPLREVELLVLPPQVVTAGQSWEEPPPNLAGMVPSHPGEKAPVLPEKIKVVDTLKALQQRGARQIAVIEVKAEASAPINGDGRITGNGPVGVNDLKITTEGTHLFDATAGELKLVELMVRVKGQDQARPDEGAPGGKILVDASLDTKVVVQPAAAAHTPAPSSKKKGRRGK